MGLMVKNFYGKIGKGEKSKTIYDFSRALNYRLETPEERIELINSLFYDEDGNVDKYFEEVFTQKFDLKSENLYEGMEELDVDMDKLTFTGANVSNIKLILSKEDNLYSETNVAKELEKMANYIIFSGEKEERVEYKIYKDEQLFHRMMKEQNFGGESQEEIDTAIHILLEKSLNFKMEAKQKIYKEDIENFEILAELQSYLEAISFRLRKIAMLEKMYGKTKGFTMLEELTYEDECYIHQFNIGKEDMTLEEYKNAQKEKGILQKTSALVKADMLEIKDALVGTIYFKQPLADSTDIDYEQLDWTNTLHMRELLRIPSKGTDLQEDMVCIQYDLEKLIQKVNLTEDEEKLLLLYRKGLTLETIAKVFGVTAQAIDKRIDALVNKVIKKYIEEHEEWYYTFEEKGTYKTCKKCGCTKLATENYFDKDKKGKLGLKATCKMCRKG